MINEVTCFLTMFYNFNQTFEVRKNCTSHQDCNLLHNLDACMSSLPRLFAATNSFQERKQRGNTQCRCHYSKCSSCCVTDILINVVNIWSHCRYHSCQASSFSQIRDDFTTFYSSIVVFVNKQWLYHNKNLQEQITVPIS